MTLATFYAEVSRALRRGTSQDAVIPDWTRDAALWLEQNYSFGYMSRVGYTLVEPGPDSQDVSLGVRAKAVEFVRLRDRADPLRYTYLERVLPSQIASIDVGDPRYYYFDGDDTIKLDGRVVEEVGVEVGAIFYTTWLADTTQTPTLVSYYPNLLKAQTLIEASIDLKDDNMRQAYDIKFQRALSAVLVAEEERKRLGTEKEMRYLG